MGLLLQPSSCWWCVIIYTLLTHQSHSRYLLGGTIERWEDPFFRKCFENILNGNWRDHDPFSLEGRLDARSSLYGRPSQSSIFRTFQGWLAMRCDFFFYCRHCLHRGTFKCANFYWPMIQSSETAPTQGTLRVYPDVLLTSAYTILRPFFSPTVPSNSSDIYDANNWKFGKSWYIIKYPNDGIKYLNCYRHLDSRISWNKSSSPEWRIFKSSAHTWIASTFAIGRMHGFSA